MESPATAQFEAMPYEHALWLSIASTTKVSRFNYCSAGVHDVKTMTAAQRGTRQCGTISTAPARAECHAIGQHYRAALTTSKPSTANRATAR